MENKTFQQMVIDSVKWAEEEDIMRRKYEYINYGHVFPTSKAICDCADNIRATLTASTIHEPSRFRLNALF